MQILVLDLNPIGGGGNRTPVPCDVTPCESSTGAEADGGCCTSGCTNIPETVPEDPDLAAVVAAWSTLPDVVRAGIVAMIAAAGR